MIYLLKHGNIAYDMLKLYFEKIFKDKTSEELERIKRILMAVNIHIAASSLTNAGFALATASFVATGINLNLELSALAGRRAGGVVGAIGIYGIVQKQQRVRIVFAFPNLRIIRYFTHMSWK